VKEKMSKPFLSRKTLMNLIVQI